MSAEKSPDLQLADSTVVKILSANNSNNYVMITFSYDNSRSKVSSRGIQICGSSRGLTEFSTLSPG
jgi:hypothetical protein